MALMPLDPPNRRIVLDYLRVALIAIGAREPDTCDGCGKRIDEGNHRACAAAAWRDHA